MRHLVGTFLVGRFFGTFLPSTLGLDAYRAYDIARHAHATIDSVTVILVEKIIGFFALSLLIVVTVPAGMSILPIEALVPIFIIFCVPVTVAFVLLIKPGVIVWFLNLNLPGTSKFEGKLKQIARAVSAYERQKRLLAVAVFFGILVHLFTTLVYYFTALSVNAPVQLADILFVGPLMIAATVGLPTIGGEGARELTFVGLLGRIGVPESQAFLLGHLGFWCGLILSLPGGLIYALRPDTYRPDIQRVEPGAKPLAAPLADVPTGETPAGGEA
ncbi:MAG: flippase-like domain-containing protein, partial [Chloroflexi bacterium]|nr:flippase-like domain-containing protein [Chloroflexota bacterium]